MLYVQAVESKYCFAEFADPFLWNDRWKIKIFSPSNEMWQNFDAVSIFTWSQTAITEGCESPLVVSYLVALLGNQFLPSIYKIILSYS